MTTSSSKPVTRETSAYVREKGLRALIVTLHGSILELRPKGLRRGECVDLGFCYQSAVKQRVAREQAEKRAARKSRK